MQHDEIIWQLIMYGHCSFRSKTVTQNFCRNEYNVTGMCNRSSCPLANSRYATIKEINGRCYLYMKTVERAHSPKNLWQRVRLSRDYGKALERIDELLAHWPKFLVHKNKQRLTKITQYLIRMRRLQLRVRPELVTMPARKEKQLKRKEAKAETAAALDKSIERELLARLQAGTYGDIYNFPPQQYAAALKKETVTDEGAELDEQLAEEEEEEAIEYVEGDDASDTEDEEEMEYLSDADLSADEDDMEDLADSDASASDDDASGGDAPMAPPAKPRGGRPPKGPAPPAARDAKRRRPRNVEIEYEEEREAAPRARR